VSDSTDSILRHLTRQFTQAGKLEAIYLRPARNIACISVLQTQALTQQGLAGDRICQTDSRNPLGSNRQVTLIQAEHLPVISALVGKSVNAAMLRRNLVISGINLLATKSLFKDQPLHLKIGEVTLEITGLCEPCSKMEHLLGQGGYNAMRGHGGVTARIIQGGQINIGDIVLCE
jgi:MOSC domain-containing protein YiiM